MVIITEIIEEDNISLQNIHEYNEVMLTSSLLEKKETPKIKYQDAETQTLLTFETNKFHLSSITELLNCSTNKFLTTKSRDINFKVETQSRDILPKQNMNSEIDKEQNILATYNPYQYNENDQYNTFAFTHDAFSIEPNFNKLLESQNELSSYIVETPEDTSFNKNNFSFSDIVFDIGSKETECSDCESDGYTLMLLREDYFCKFLPLQNSYVSNLFNMIKNISLLE